MRRIIAASVLCATLAACAGTDRTTATAAPSAIVGSYVVSSFAGKQLPVAIAQDARGAVYLAADTLTINADGSFTRSGHLRAGTDLASATDDGAMMTTGTVSGSPDALHFKSGGSSFDGALAGTRLSVTGAVTVVFDKL